MTSIRVVQSYPRDFMDTAVNSLMGLAAFVAVGVFLGMMVRVSDRAPSIAQGLNSRSLLQPSALVAKDHTNHPAAAPDARTTTSRPGV